MIESRALAACTHSGMLRPGALPPYAAPDRITEQAINADYESIEMLQLRLALLNRNGAVPTSNYNWPKAQCWIDMARHNYHENDRTGTIEAALQQSATLIKGLEARAVIPRETPLIPESVKIRDDLWARAQAYKQIPQFSCVAPLVAATEVESVEIHTGTLEVNGQTANQWGTYRQVAGAKGQPRQTYEGRYAALWHLESDGRWRLFRLTARGAGIL